MHFLDPNQTQQLPSSVSTRHPEAGSSATSAMPQQTMQTDCVAWQARLEQWKSDHAHWQADHDGLLRRLADMQRAVVEHGRSLAAHEALFAGVVKSLAEFESLIAVTRTATASSGPPPITQQHSELLSQVQCCENAHNRMAQHHAAVMSRMAELERAISSPL